MSKLWLLFLCGDPDFIKPASTGGHMGFCQHSTIIYNGAMSNFEQMLFKKTSNTMQTIG